MNLRAPIIAFCVFALISVGTTANADTYKIDAAHSAIMFKAQHFGAGYTYGRFMRFSGTFNLAGPGKRSSVSVEVAAASVFTGQKKRDRHIKSPDFLNVKQFPKITFKSSKVTRRGKTYTVKGTLSLHGVSKKVTIKMKLVGKGQNTMSKTELAGFEGQISIKRSHFGMTKLVGPVSDKLTLMFAFEGIKQ